MFGDEGCVALCTENGSLGEGSTGGPDAPGASAYRCDFVACFSRCGGACWGVGIDGECCGELVELGGVGVCGGGGQGGVLPSSGAGVGHGKVESSARVHPCRSPVALRYN